MEGHELEPEALEVAHDRYVEKLFFTRIGIPVPAYRAVTTRTDYDEAIREIGLPAVLKTRRFGYDGKGQHLVRGPGDVGPALDRAVRTVLRQQ